MNGILDLRTILFGYIISSAISAAVIASLYSQNRRRSPELVYLPAGFILQFLGIVAISLRGVLPDILSIVVGNSFLMFQAILILSGLGRFMNKPVLHRPNLILGVVFTGVAAYFTYAQPSLLARNLVFSSTLFIVCLQGAILMFRDKDCRDCPPIRLAGFIFAGYCIFSFLRIASDLAINPGEDFLNSNLPNTLVIIVYQMLSICLTFALFLIVNRRLVINLEEDIEKRSLVEEALRKSEEKFSKAFHNIPDALVVSLAVDGTVLEVNESFSRITGFSRDEVIGKNAIDLKIWSSPADRKVYAKELIRSGRINNFEARFLRKNGQEIIGLISSEVIYLTQGECFLNIIRDITESKNIEREEKQQRVLAEALLDSTAALNSTLKFNEVLVRILDNVGRVTPHDTANIMVMEDDDSAVILLCRGYQERGKDDLTNKRVSLSTMPILKAVAIDGKPLAIPDTKMEPDWRSTPAVEWVNSYIVAPIRSRGRTIGFLNLESGTAGFFNSYHANRLQAFADQASIAIDNARRYEDVREMAITDALTGLFNRRGLFQLGEREVTRSQRFQHPLAAVMLDIDHFKIVNDTYGHATGDGVLTVLAACLRGQVRNVDLLARYGGEEFTILLPEIELKKALTAAERVRKAVAGLEIPASPDSATLKITVSLGVVMLTPETPDLAGLLERADQALYKAKRKGRNRVEAGGKPAPAR